MLLGTLGASLLGNLLTGGKGIMRAGEGVKKNNLKSLLPFHPLTNFEIMDYYKNEPQFIGKTLLQFTNLLSLYDFKKNDDIVGKMFK